VWVHSPKIKISIMQTRSQTKSQTRSEWVPTTVAVYEVDIDFDEASKMWKFNKKRMGNGTYKYICCELNKSGLKCGRNIADDAACCKTHNKKLCAF
jgi:hypothetical protein